jgi:hypothetical protein
MKLMLSTTLFHFVGLVLIGTALGGMPIASLIFNGDFDTDRNGDGAPDG